MFFYISFSLICCRNFEGKRTGFMPNIELLKTGKYTPQNRSTTPYPLDNFDPAETSLQKQKKE